MEEGVGGGSESAAGRSLEPSSRGGLVDLSLISLARNLPPKILCACGELATQVCGQCNYDATSWLCKKCAAKHECGEEMFLPVVNSPRVGVCAYTG